MGPNSKLAYVRESLARAIALLGEASQQMQGVIELPGIPHRVVGDLANLKRTIRNFVLCAEAMALTEKEEGNDVRPK